MLKKTGFGVLAKAGFAVNEPENLFAWVAQEWRRAAILEVKLSNIGIAAELGRSGPDLIIVGLLAEPSECAYRAAPRLGVFPVRWDSSPSYISSTCSGWLSRARVTVQVSAP